MPTKTITGKMYYSQIAYGNEILTTNHQVTFSYTEDAGLESGTATIYKTDTLSGVPIVLIDASGNGICTLTDSTGTFTFNNVTYSDTTSTSYTIIEAFGRTDGVVNADWNNKKQLGSVTSKDPSVAFVGALGLNVYDATNIVSISPNLFKINISTSGNVSLDSNYKLPTGQDWNKYDNGPIPANTLYFMDCCVRYIPFEKNGNVPYGPNLITKGDGGTFGQYPAGTSNSTSPASSPYTDLGEFTYSMYSDSTPQDAHYSITNIATQRTFERRWFEIPDHSFGDERGRFMIVNGTVNDVCFFQEQIDDLDSNGKFVFTAWIVNIYRCSLGKPPYFKIEIVTVPDGTVEPTTLFVQNITADFPVTTIPTWKQIGTEIDFSTINIPDNQKKTDGTVSIIAKFVSTYTGEVPASGNINGNDIGIDDIRFRKVAAKLPGVTLTKSTADSEPVLPNEPFQYTITLTNNTSSYLSDCIFIDPLPHGTELASSNMSINISDLNLTDVQITDAELESGKNLSTIIASNVSNTDPYYSDLSQGKIPAGKSLTLTYSIKITDLNNLEFADCVHNEGRFDYTLGLDILNKVDITRTIISNEVKTDVIYPVLDIDKEYNIIKDGNEVKVTEDDTLFCNDDVILKITLSNSGTADASDIYVEDLIDSRLVPQNSTPPSKSWAGSITKQTKSPLISEQTFIPDTDIELINGEYNNLKIKNLLVPKSTIIGETGEKDNGQCIIRIFCKINC